MKLSNILLLVTIAFKCSNSKSVATSNSFSYNFNCNDKNNFCVSVRKELADAVSSLSSILDLSPTVHFDAIVDDISKYRSDTEQETYGTTVDNNFTILDPRNDFIISPYPNAKSLINTFGSGNKFANDDFILLLNNFNSNSAFKESSNSDYRNNAIKEIMKGLQNLNMLQEPYNNTSSGNSPPSGGPGGPPPSGPGGPPPSGPGGPPPDGQGGNPPPSSSNICETIKNNNNSTALLENAKKNDETCEKTKLNKLNTIISWKNKLITDDSSGKSQPYKRLIAVGDIHGDYDKLVSVLRHAKLINKNNKWIASNTIFVQTGDLIDRGNDIKAILDLLSDLVDQAKKKKSEIHLLLGNHEISNLQGNYQHVSSGDINSFKSLEERENAFSPSGKYGKLLRNMEVALVINDSLFAHAGVLPEFAEIGVDAMNERVHEILMDTPSVNDLCKLSQNNVNHPLFTDSILNDNNGPLNTRSFANDSESVICPKLEKTLKLTNTKRMIIGHTVQEYGEMVTRCNNKLILVDVGMSECYGGFFGYIEFLNNKNQIWAIHS